MRFTLRAALCLLLLGAAPLTGSPARQNAQQPSAAPQITVQSWSQPAPGWLYVLDTLPPRGGPGGRVLLLDPLTGKIMGEISTGPSPDFAISPDGTRLYVASDLNVQWSDLAVIDTASGAILARGSLAYRVVPAGMPPFSTMAVSPDGSAVRILVNSLLKPDTDGWQLATFDTHSDDFLPANVHLGNCGYGGFVDDPAAGEFEFFCPTTNRLRLIQVDSEGRELANVAVLIPWERRLGLASIFPGTEQGRLEIVRGDGAAFTMSLATQMFSATPARGDEQGRILPARWPLSPDGRSIYLGYNRNPNHRFYLDYDRSPSLNPRTESSDEFHVFDTASWRRLSTIKTRKPFWSAVTSADGKTLYALAPSSHSLLVIDTDAHRQVRAIPVPGAPALALLAP